MGWYLSWVVRSLLSFVILINNPLLSFRYITTVYTPPRPRPRPPPLYKYSTVVLWRPLHACVPKLLLLLLRYRPLTITNNYGGRYHTKNRWLFNHLSDFIPRRCRDTRLCENYNCEIIWDWWLSVSFFTQIYLARVTWPNSMCQE